MNDLAVLIPVYNDQEPLIAALDSIVEPDNSFTVVISDGGSPERLVIDHDRYPFKIVVLYSEERIGIVDGLNTGLKYIRENGFKVVARLDAGDLQKPGRLSKQYQRMEQVEDLAMVGSNAIYFGEESGKVLFTTELPLNTKQIRKWCVFRTTFIHPTVMIRLDRIDDSLKYESDYPHIEDYVLFTKIAERYKTENLEEPLLECLVREGGISLSNDRTQLLSGIRHHLKNPRLLTPLWYAYILKRSLYLITPFSLRVKAKKLLGFIKKPEQQAASSTAITSSVAK